MLRGGATYETQFANSAAHTLLGSVGGDRGQRRRRASAPSSCSGSSPTTTIPTASGRVRVKYPALGDDVEGAWARIASVSAGNARGLMMLPVVGEEVLIGFEHDDTTRPYVLGSLFNGVDMPGDDLTQGQDGSFAVLSDQKIVAESKEDMKLTQLAAQLTIRRDADGDVNAAPASQAFDVEGQTVTHQGGQRPDRSRAPRR